MGIDVIEEPTPALADYGDIPIAFEVREVLDVITEADGGVRLESRQLAVAYIKDYDAVGEGPMQWAERFDLSTWGFFSAFNRTQCVGRRLSPAIRRRRG